MSKHYLFFKIFEGDKCSELEQLKIKNINEGNCLKFNNLSDLKWIKGTSINTNDKNIYTMVLSNKKFNKNSSYGRLRKDKMNNIYVTYNNNSNIEQPINDNGSGGIGIPFNDIIFFPKKELLDILPCTELKELKNEIITVSCDVNNKYYSYGYELPPKLKYKPLNENVDSIYGGAIYKKTEKKVKCGNQTRKVYLQGRTRYVKYGGKYEKLTPLLEKLKIKK